MTGHNDEVVDMCLAFPFQGEISDPVATIITVGKDRTTRILAPLNGRLCEIARPQVHGHDFFAVAVIPGAFPDCLVTSSEEKVIRVFSAPSSYHEYLFTNGITSVPPSELQTVRLAYGASIKALALTNTAVYEEDIQDRSQQQPTEGIVENYTPGPDFAPNASPCCVSGAPLEEHLSQNTLWPETQKLYGHGDVVYSLAASPCGSYLASACKAQKEDTAAIFLWDTATWALLQQLRGHTLTVTRLEFSPSGQYLLSGSRDRTFCLYEKKETAYQFTQRKTKAHQRIIWDVSWTPDERHFLTASRDQSTKLWSAPDCHCVLQMTFPDGVTAAAFQPKLNTDCPDAALMACGLQNGDICVHKIVFSGDTCAHEHVYKTDVHDRHSAAVYRLLWLSPASLKQGRNGTSIFLASCSADHSFRLFEFS